MESIRNFFNYILPSAPAPVVPVAPQKPADNAVKFNPLLQYENPSTANLSTVGYYMDFTQEPIGNRPVYGTYANYVYPAARVVFKDKKLDCKQPVWGDNCM